MSQFYAIFCLVLLSVEAISNEMPTGAVADTNVINLSFCESSLPTEYSKGKKTLEEVHTYAELEDDRLASLPETFTVCSTIMISGCKSSYWPMFFNILDNNGDQLLAPFTSHGHIGSRLNIGFKQWDTQQMRGKIPQLFPNQWIKSCMAVNTTSGLIHWVVEGTLVLAREFVEVKNSKSKNIILGSRLYGDYWFAVALKVTNLDIFSSPFSIEKMERMTRGGRCVEEGDYLA